MLRQVGQTEYTIRITGLEWRYLLLWWDFILRYNHRQFFTLASVGSDFGSELEIYGVLRIKVITGSKGFGFQKELWKELGNLIGIRKRF
ncbi:hypothetical protein [Bacillus thuringiensis]|uniref:hypothetical protein n=1 Tax=Bacillus thuringiensis TaxID=1428 RepID=UPI001145200A|nr:hypothetical protein [Bacillus thuringiensis]